MLNMHEICKNNDDLCTYYLICMNYVMLTILDSLIQKFSKIQKVADHIKIKKIRWGGGGGGGGGGAKIPPPPPV